MKLDFNPNNPEITKLFNKLTTYPGTSINSNLAKEVVKFKTIRYLRDKKHMYIAKDRAKNKSIIFFPPNVKINKKENGNGFFFDIF